MSAKENVLKFFEEHKDDIYRVLELDKIFNIIHELKKQDEEILNLVKSSCSSDENLLKENQHLKELITELQNSKEELEKELKLLEELKVENIELTAQLEELNEYKEINEELKKEIEALKASIEEQIESKTKQILEEKENLIAQLKELEEKNSDLTAILEKIKDENKKIIQELNQLEEENKELLAENSKMQLELQKRVLDLELVDELKQENQELKNEIDELNLKNSELEGSIVKLKHKVNMLESKNEEFKSINQHLKDEIDELHKTNQHHTNTIRQLKQENQELKDEVLNCKNSQNIAIRSEFGQTQSKLQSLYLSLDNSTKLALENVFKGNDDITLFVSGILNLDSIWEYASYLRREHKDEEFEKVREIFYILFDVYKKIKNARFQDVYVGDRFDLEEHIRDNRSVRQSGLIEEVVLKGYIENGKLVKKSIVKVR